MTAENAADTAGHLLQREEAPAARSGSLRRQRLRATVQRRCVLGGSPITGQEHCRMWASALMPWCKLLRHLLAIARLVARLARGNRFAHLNVKIVEFAIFFPMAKKREFMFSENAKSEIHIFRMFQSTCPPPKVKVVLDARLNGAAGAHSVRKFIHLAP